MEAKEEGKTGHDLYSFFGVEEVTHSRAHPSPLYDFRGVFEFAESAVRAKISLRLLFLFAVIAEVIKSSLSRGGIKYTLTFIFFLFFWLWMAHIFESGAFFWVQVLAVLMSAGGMESGIIPKKIFFVFFFSAVVSHIIFWFSALLIFPEILSLPGHVFLSTAVLLLCFSLFKMCSLKDMFSLRRVMRRPLIAVGRRYISKNMRSLSSLPEGTRILRFTTFRGEKYTSFLSRRGIIKPLFLPSPLLPDMQEVVFVPPPKGEIKHLAGFTLLVEGKKLSPFLFLLFFPEAVFPLNYLKGEENLQEILRRSLMHEVEEIMFSSFILRAKEKIKFFSILRILEEPIMQLTAL